MGGRIDWLFWRVVSTFILSEGEGNDESIHVVFRDEKRPLNIREGKNEEDAVLTSYSPNQNYIHPMVCPRRYFPLSPG